jgi:hypothetical protein
MIAAKRRLVVMVIRGKEFLPSTVVLEDPQQKKETAAMSEPLIRIYLTPRGVQKIDAPVKTDEDRTKAFEFFTDRASAAIKQLDTSMRAEIVR